MIDGRSTYAKVLHLHYLLTQDYTLDSIIHYKDIEYLITSTFGYTDRRTYEKFFDLLEQRFFIIKTSNARPIAPKKTVTKQKTNGGGIKFQFFRGERYCWSHYRLGSTPLKPRSPRSPLQSRFQEGGWMSGGKTSENICVRVEAGVEDGTVPRDRRNDVLQVFPLTKAGESDGVERGKRGEREKRESSIPHTHIVIPNTPKSDGETGVKDYLHLLKNADTKLQDKSSIIWNGAETS